jgi:hypothetical protein
MKRVRRRDLARLAALVVAGACAAACGGGTTAATQPTPAGNDDSDPRAVALADDVIARLGGAAAWDAVVQLRWEQRHTRDGKLEDRVRHAWDRRNGRHRFEQIDVASVGRAGSAEAIPTTVVIHDLVDRAGAGTATFGGKPVDATTRDQLVTSAHRSFLADSYRLTAVHKLRDPGAKLSMKPPIPPVQDHCNPGCDVIEVTTAPEAGSDTWLISVNSNTRLPELVEKRMAQGKLGFAMSAWTEVGGLRFPTRFENLGVSESYEIRDLRVGDPDDDLYVPTATE